MSTPMVITVTALTTVVQLCMQGQLSGWAGIGFGPVHYAMDTYVGWVTSSGLGVLQEGYSSSWSIPSTVNSTEAKLISASQIGQTFRMCFTRPWDNTVRPATTVTAAWALHRTANPNDASPNALYAEHTDRGIRQLAIPQIPQTAPPSPRPSISAPSRPTPTLTPTLTTTTQPTQPSQVPSSIPSTSPTSDPGSSVQGDTNFFVSWTRNDDRMVFQYDCATTGWVGIGFDRDSRIHTATDMYVSWILTSGTGIIYDGYSTTQQQPTLDVAQAANVTFAVQRNGRLQLGFSRSVTSSDARDLNLTDWMYVGWAYHPTANPNTAFLDQAIIPIHSARGTVRVNFETGQVREYGGGAFLPSTYYLLAWGALFTIGVWVCFLRDHTAMRVTYPQGFYRGSQYVPWLQTRMPFFGMSKIDMLLVVIVLLLNLASVIAGVYNGFSQAQIWGYLCAANSLLVAVPATRNSVLLWVTGLPIDQTIRYHRWLGRLTIIEGVVHTACSVDLPFFTWTVTNGYGLGAMLCLGVIAVSSVEYVRRHAFNLFFYTHHILFAYFGFGALHSRTFLVYAIAAAAVYGLDRLIRLGRGIYPRRISSVARLSSEIVKLAFPKRQPHRPGQYVFLNFPGISLLEWHPFTLADAPDDPQHEVYIKTLGDHTRAIMERVRAGDWVRMDGPYGNVLVDPAKVYSHLLFVCGGVGITPCLSFIRQVFAAPDSSRVIRHLYLVWCCPTEEDAHWVNHELVHALERARDIGYPGFHLYVFITGQARVQNPTYFVGRPDIDQVFDTMQNHIVADQTRACVHVCGPKSLSDSVWETWSRRLASTPCDFKQEIFDF